MTPDKALETCIEWANERLRNGSEPPWIYYRLMQLKEAATELLPHGREVGIAVNMPGLSNCPRDETLAATPVVPLRPIK